MKTLANDALPLHGQILTSLVTQIPDIISLCDVVGQNRRCVGKDIAWKGTMLWNIVVPMEMRDGAVRSASMKQSVDLTGAAIQGFSGLIESNWTI